MKIYRRVVPKIAKDVLRSLLTNRSIEIEDGRRDEAELDVATSVVTYLDAIDKLKSDAEIVLRRKNLGPDKLHWAKTKLAEQRNIPLRSGAEDFVVKQVIEGLFDSKWVLEIFADDDELDGLVRAAFGKYVGVDSELDREVRHKLKNLREGTVEWEAEYGRLIGQMRAMAQGEA